MLISKSAAVPVFHRSHLPTLSSGDFRICQEDGRVAVVGTSAESTVRRCCFETWLRFSCAICLSHQQRRGSPRHARHRFLFFSFSSSPQMWVLVLLLLMASFIRSKRSCSPERGAARLECRAIVHLVLRRPEVML
jgi:hypothetical protein